jgi:CubicO group peptidase (beta-lactamase class C family)
LNTKRLTTIAVAAAAAAVPGTVAASPRDGAELADKLQQVEAALQKQANDAHVTGYGLAIVKDGKVLLAKGYGWRDAEHKLPVTADTLFAIGSSTKAFTAFTVEQEADAKRLSLADAPRKYVPTFRLYDKDADSKMTISDLMCHRCGLARTDFAMVTGQLTPLELLKVVAEAHPTAKFGEKFQYQNLMFMTAGLVVESIERKPWTQVVTSKILNPIGMKRTNLSVSKTLADPDHSDGFTYDADKKASRRLPMRDISAVAPAGAINSSASEMTHWIELMLDGGKYEGKQLLSPARFAELGAKHMTAGPNIGYGYGWFLRKWQDHAVMEHGGNIDGFSAQVALMPDQHLGFVLLTNENATPFAPGSIETVFSGLLGKDKKPTEVQAAANTAPPSSPAEEAGAYHLDAANVDLTVALKENQLTLVVPGQPEYKLEPTGGRKYKLAGAPGFSVEFRSVKDKPKLTEMVLNQPNGTFIAVRNLSGVDETAAYNGPDKDLIGTYENISPAAEFPVKVVGGKVCFLVTGQPAYALKPVEGKKNEYRLGDLPEAFGITVVRDNAGAVTGMELKQPQGNLHLKRVSERATAYNAEEIAGKAEAALGRLTDGGLHAVKIVCKDSMINEGVTAKTTTMIDGDGRLLESADYYGAGKKIAMVRQYFDGTAGMEQTTISDDRPLSSKEIESIKLDTSSLYRPWQANYKSVAVRRIVKVGSEDAYVLVKTPLKEGISPVTEYISVKTLLPLKRQTTIATEAGALAVTEEYSNYKKFGSIMLPQTTRINIMGTTRIRTIEGVEQMAALPATALQAVKGNSASSRPA